MGTKIYNKKEEETEDDLNIYSEEVRQLLLEDDAIDSTEDAFMKGYDEAL